MSSAGTKYAGRINRRRRWLLYAVGVGTWLSGGLWLLFHYFLMQNSEFGPTPHPLEIWWLRVHGAFAFAAMWLFGLIWGVHVAKALPFESRKPSGIALVALLFALMLTGYLLYYVGSESARPVISVVHWVLGVACPGFYFLHRSPKRKRKQARGTRTVPMTTH